MNPVDPNLRAPKVSWLPNRYSSRFMLEQDDSEHRAVVGVDRITSKAVYVECLPAYQFGTDDIFRLEQFFNVSSEINSEHYVAPIDWGRTNANGEELLFWVRPHVPGKNLESNLLVNPDSGQPQNGDLLPNVDLKRRWLRKFLHGIQQLHAANLTQQDFRLTAILTENEQPRLLAPGLRLFSNSKYRSQSWSMAFGKTASPELLGLIEHDVSQQSDIYSVGIILYCLVNHRLPFEGASISSVLSQHLTQEIEIDGSDETNSNLLRIARRMLEKKPENRYRCIESILEDLDWLDQHNDGSKRDEPQHFVAGYTDARDTLSTPSFYGRQPKINAIRGCVDRIKQGEKRTVLVTGESGNGKTRLIREALRDAHHLGIEVYSTEATELATDLAGAPLMRLINSLKDRSEIHDYLAVDLASEKDEICRFFPDLAAAIGFIDADNKSDTDEAYLEENLPPQETNSNVSFELSRLCRATCRVLSNLSRPNRPAVLWIDDCQWLDATTIEALNELSRWDTQSFLLILSSRTSAESSQTDQLDFSFNARIHAGPLPNPVVRRIIDSMAYGLPPEAVDIVVNLASGSPFMGEALLRGMVELGALRFQDSKWVVDTEQLNELQATSDASEALLMRLEQFPAKILESLSLAALIGRSFSSAAVCAISEISDVEFRQHMDWARRQRIVWSRPDGSHAFLHDRIRNALIARLPDNTQQSLHISLARHIRDSGGPQSEVAIHFDLGGRPHEAFWVALKAATQARESSSLSTALQMLQIAWRGLGKENYEQRSQIAENIGHVLMLTGRYEEGDHWFDLAAKSAMMELDQARIQVRRSELAFKKGEKCEAASLIEDAMESLGISVPRNWFSIHLCLILEGLRQTLHSLFPKLFLQCKSSAASDRDRLVWQMYSRLAHCYWYTRTKSASLWAHLSGMNRAELYPATRELGQAWSEHAPAMSLVPWYARGAKYLQRSLKARKRLNDYWGQGQSRNYFSLLLYATSRFQRCIQEANEAEEILLKTGDYWELNITRYQHAASLYRLGRLDESIELCKRTYEDAFKVGDYQSTGNIIDVLARASLGNIPFQYIETEKNRCLDDAQLQTQILRAEGVYHLGKGNPNSAVDCFQQAIEIARKSGVCNCYTSGMGAWLATSIRLKCDQEEEQGIASKATRKRQFRAARKSLWLAYRFRNDLPHALRELGFAWMHKGNTRLARKYFSKSLQIANRQNARYEAALTQKAFESMDSDTGFRSGEDRRESGDYVVREIESKIRKSSTKRETISIADRFDALIDAGRKISSALSKEKIFDETVSVAMQLLRGQLTLILVPDTSVDPPTWKPWNSEEQYDASIVEEAVKSRKAIVRDEETLGHAAEQKTANSSVLCCPIIAGENVAACVYIANRLIKSIYGSDEARIADFIANAAGSSLEKETSFRELDELNANLEEKVWERTRSLRSRTIELERTAQELRATQHSLQHAVDAAESANQIKSDFLAKMSHEIRTPITAVLGFTQLILRGVISDPEEKRKKIRSIESSGKHLLNLVNDLLDISKIEANKIETEKIECRPLHLLSEVVESLRAKAIENDNDLQLNFVSPMPATIQSDPKRLRQVVTNILGNAIKFTSGGDVTLTVTLADSVIEGRNDLKIDVTDSGIGMSEQQVKNVFDPFVQADSSITRRFGGTGLGLSISRKLAQAMGGEIEVTSEEGVGSTFSIAIDAGERKSLELLDEDQLEGFMQRRVSSDAITADLNGVNILLADDAETNRDLISLVLSDCNAKVWLANNGQEAVELASSDHSFDMILMDMQMPVLDGYSATQKLRENGCELPIFALTANSMKGDRDKCIAAGCSDYLTKPIDINTLVKTIAKTVGRKVTAAEVDESDLNQATESIAKTDALVKTKPDSPDGIPFDACDIPSKDPLQRFAIKFLNTLNERWSEFEAGVTHCDAKEIASLAHWLKGTSGTVGLLKLSDAAKTMEAAVHSKDWTTVTNLKDHIKSYLTAALDSTLEIAAS